MKKIIKIEIILLVLLLIVAAGMTLVSRGVVILKEPVLMERTPKPIPQDEQPTEAVPETVPVTTAPPDQAGPPQVAATRYFAYDLRENAYIRTLGDVDEKLYPASITKLLTSYTVLQYMDPATSVTVGDALTLVEEDSSVADLQEGDVLTVEQLIAAMMLPSGNDAAQIAAVTAGRRIAQNESLPPENAVDVFMNEMNVQAEALGMENSHFVTPDGFHRDNHYTTMDDLIILCQKVLAEPVILKYASRATDAVILPDRVLEWKNTNLLLHPESECYLPNTIGLKTGYTDAAGGCLVTAFFEEDRLLLIGVFGATAYTTDRYLDTVDIYNSI